MHDSSDVTGAAVQVRLEGPLFAELENWRRAQPKIVPRSWALRQPRIVADARWPGMWRLQLADGTLTDLVNLTRARDALASLAAARRSQGRASGPFSSWATTFFKRARNSSFRR